MIVWTDSNSFPYYNSTSARVATLIDTRAATPYATNVTDLWRLRGNIPSSGTGLAWSGDRALAVWADGKCVDGAVLDGDLNKAAFASLIACEDNQGQPVADAAYEPSMVSSARGVAIAYVANGVDDVPRAFVRTLDRIAGAGRGRAVGH
jgi:hypothetical protein